MTTDPLHQFTLAVRKEVRRRIGAAIKAGRVPDFREQYRSLLESAETDPVYVAASAYLAFQQAPASDD